MLENPLLAAWRAGRATANAWLGLGDGLSAEVIARRGYDSVTFDLQHGAASLADLLADATLGLALVVRIREAYGTIEEDELLAADAEDD